MEQLFLLVKVSQPSSDLYELMFSKLLVAFAIVGILLFIKMSSRIQERMVWRSPASK